MKYFSSIAVLASLFLFAALGHAQKDSFSIAAGIIEDFSAEKEDLLANLEQSVKDSDKDYINKELSSSKNERADAAVRLKNLRWLESDPNRFSKKVFSIVNTYTNKQIGTLKELSGRLTLENRKEIARIIERITIVRDSSLKKLADTQKEERVMREKLRLKEKLPPVSDVPQID